MLERKHRLLIMTTREQILKAASRSQQLKLQVIPHYISAIESKTYLSVGTQDCQEWINNKGSK